MSGDRPLAGRRALVTGASRGIGAALAERLGAEGADVAVSARTAERHPTLPGSLAGTAERVRAHGARCVVVVADLADGDDRARVVPEAVDGLGGPLDILVNNAAAAVYQPLADFPLRRRRLSFEVNVHAPMDLAQQALPSMVERGEGWIVNVSSATAARQPGPPFAGPRSAMGVYGASKAALERLTNALAAELWGTGVRVNALAPRAGVRTEGTDVLVGSLPPDQLEPLEAMVEATLYLCRCPEAETGGVAVSLELLERHGLPVHALDGTPL